MHRGIKGEENIESYIKEHKMWLVRQPVFNWSKRNANARLGRKK
jgi:hypothetical protein